MTTTTYRPAIVVARPGALDAALGQRSRRSVARAVEDRYGTPKEKHTLRLFAEPGYGFAKDKAARVAEALGVPVEDVFCHTDGTPIA